MAAIISYYPMILGIMGACGMTVGLIRSGNVTNTSVYKLKSNIDKLNDINDKMNEKLKKANNDIIDLTQEEKDEYESLIRQYQNLHNNINDTKIEFSSNLRKIQINGIFFIVIVFFLLILKQFNLLDPLIYVILYPFTYIFSFFTKK